MTPPDPNLTPDPGAAPDPNVTPAPLTRGWKGGAWPVIAAAVALIGVYATLAVTHERAPAPRPVAATSAQR